GGDRIEVVGSLSRIVFLYGGSGSDVLIGGPGSDVLVGGDGNDTLSDYAGNNILIGGAGRDSISTGFGQNVLIGDGTICDNNDQALTALWQVWSGSGAFNARADALAAGVSVNGATLKLNAAAIVPDHVADQFFS